MRILAIESSCDETGASIVESLSNNQVKFLSNALSTSLDFHAKTGGIIPENAAREQLKYIIPVIEKAFKDANLPLKSSSIDAIAVTVGPGLIGSLLVGVETARTLGYFLNIPIIPVNHLYGHIYANFIQGKIINENKITFPAIGLIISGAHTDLVLMDNIKSIKWLGGTRDDAAGEAFDKVGRLLGLSYPAGPEMERLAKKGNPNAYKFPRPMIGSNDLDFSFSGLKTAVLREVQKLGGTTKLTKKDLYDLSASFQQAVIDVIVSKTLKACSENLCDSVLLGGGVAASEALRTQLIKNAKEYSSDLEIFFPDKYLCTDNAVMIGAAAVLNPATASWKNIQADPELYFD